MDMWTVGGDRFAELPRGVRGVAVRFTSHDAPSLHPAEAALAAGMGPQRRADFAAGRACARRALIGLDVHAAVLAEADGAPLWPSGMRGSISHKDGVAVAVVGSDAVVAGIGVDIEVPRPLPTVVLDSVLTPAELRQLTLAGHDAGVAARLAFCAKEAYYKWFRSAGRSSSVGFQDIRVVVEGSTLRFESDVPGRFPQPHGAHARGHDWLMTVAWS